MMGIEGDTRSLDYSSCLLCRHLPLQQQVSAKRPSISKRVQSRQVASFSAARASLPVPLEAVSCDDLVVAAEGTNGTV